MDSRYPPFDSPIFNAIFQFLDPIITFFRDVNTMTNTPADIKEYTNKYEFIIDMPGLKSEDIKLQIEDDNMLVISGERTIEDEKEGLKYLTTMVRRAGKFLQKFELPRDANHAKINAVYQDGVLCVSVEKLPPKKPKKIEVKVA